AGDDFDRRARQAAEREAGSQNKGNRGQAVHVYAPFTTTIHSPFRRLDASFVPPALCRWGTAFALGSVDMSERAAGTAREVGLLASAFMWRVFYTFGAVALLSVAISVGGKWLGRSIALGGHTEDTTVSHVVIGNNIVSAPANTIRFERDRVDHV